MFFLPLFSHRALCEYEIVGRSRCQNVRIPIESFQDSCGRLDIQPPQTTGLATAFLHGEITPAEWLREPHTIGAQSKFGNYEREQPLLGSSSRFHRTEPSPYSNVVQTWGGEKKKHHCVQKISGFVKKYVFGC